MRKRLIDAGVRNLREFGYSSCDSENILTDKIYSAFFLSMLKDNLGKGADGEINKLISEIEKPKNHCAECANLKVSGTFKPSPMDKSKKPFRVLSKRGKTTLNHGDFDAIEMAQAAACGTDAKIFKRKVR